MVYRYFYGFSDQDYVHRPLSQLMKVFPWNSPTNRFATWLKKRLDEAVKHNLVEDYKIEDDYCSVKCFPLSSFTQTIEIEKDASKAKRLVVGAKGELKAAATNSSKSLGSKKIKERNLSDEDLYEEYLSRKSQGLFSEENIELINILLKHVERDRESILKKKMLRQNLSSLLKMT